MRRFRSQAGWSLVEVIMATAIIAVALAPLLNVFLTSQKGVQGASSRVEAMALARSAMDEVLREDYHTMALGTRPWTPHYLDAGYEVQVTIEAATTYMTRTVVEIRKTGKTDIVVTLYSTVIQRSAP